MNGAENLDYCHLDTVIGRGWNIPSKTITLPDGSGTVMGVELKDVGYLSRQASEWWTARVLALSHDERQPPPNILELGAGLMNRSVFLPLDYLDQTPGAEYFKDRVRGTIHAVDRAQHPLFSVEQARMAERFPRLMMHYHETDLRTIEPIQHLAQVLASGTTQEAIDCIEEIDTRGMGSYHQLWQEVGKPTFVGYEGVGDYLSPEVNSAYFALISHYWRPDQFTLRWVFDGNFERNYLTLEQRQSFHDSSRRAEGVLLRHWRQRSDLRTEPQARFGDVIDRLFEIQNTVLTPQENEQFREASNLYPGYQGTYPMLDLVARYFNESGYSGMMDYIAYEREIDRSKPFPFRSQVGSVVMTFSKLFR